MLNPIDYKPQIDDYFLKVKESNTNSNLKSKCPESKVGPQHKKVYSDEESKVSSHGDLDGSKSKQISPFISISQRDGKATPCKSQLTQLSSRHDGLESSQSLDFNTLRATTLFESQSSTQGIKKNNTNHRNIRSSPGVKLSANSNSDDSLTREAVQQFVTGLPKQNVSSNRTYLCSNPSHYTYGFTYICLEIAGQSIQI